MPRAKNNVPAKKRHKKILKAAKGYRLSRSKIYVAAKDQVDKSGRYAYRDRRTKKRSFRALWIARINAACRLNGISYSKLIHALKEKSIALDRKSLAHLAMHEPKVFEQLIQHITA